MPRIAGYDVKPGVRYYVLFKTTENDPNDPDIAYRDTDEMYGVFLRMKGNKAVFQDDNGRQISFEDWEIESISEA